MGRSKLLLTSLAMLGIVQLAAGVCCNVPPKCKSVPTVPGLTIQTHVSKSPFYQAISSGPSSVQESNSCYTYFPINNSTFLQFVTSNNAGSLYVQVAIISALDCPGAFRIQGLYDIASGNDTTVHNTYYFNEANCSEGNPIYIGYRCFLLDSCEYINYPYDIVYGLSSSPKSSPACLKRFKNLVRSSGLQVNGFTKASGQPRCVVYYNNATCINGENVNSKFAITYPQDVPSAGC